MKVKREQAIASLELYRQEYQRVRQEQIQINLDQTNNVNQLQFKDPETEPFNEEKWDYDYTNDNPPPQVPDVIVDDIDNDLEVLESQ